MFVLGHKAAAIAHQGPTIRQRVGIGGSSGNKSLNGYHGVFLEPCPVGFVPVVGNLARLLVKASAYTMAGQVPDYFIAPLLCFAFHQKPMSEMRTPPLIFEMALCKISLEDSINF